MDKPKVISYTLASIDGRITLSPETLLLFGDARWEAAAGNSEEVYSRIFSQFKPGALLEGSGSFVLPNSPVEPLPSIDPDPALYQDYLPVEITSVPSRMWMTVVDSKGLIRWMYKEFPGEVWAGFYLLVCVSSQTPPAYLTYLRRELIPYIVSGTDQVDLKKILGKLSALGVRNIVSTAGGRLSGALVRQGLLDEIWVEYFPAIIGGKTTPSLFSAPNLIPQEHPILLSLRDCQVLPNQHILASFSVIQEQR
jgi:2,5-diamino-6-(ribosylamino)-4(3H)-pyrimidinone 5'-phosphate reductase